MGWRLKQILIEAIEKLSYKPGWTFAVEEYAGVDGKPIIALNIKVEATCIDSGDPITIDRTFIASQSGPRSDLAQFLGSMTPPEFTARSFIVGCIQEIETHEQNEWLKFSGQRFFPDPHEGET